VLRQRRQAAAWRRWSAKLPHNRVRRPRLRDDRGRVIAYGEPVSIPEPPLPASGCRMVTKPSGKVELILAGSCGADLRRLQEAYRLARRPQPSEADVPALPVTLTEVRDWLAAVEART
jgi:hypothetical protein